MNKFEEMMMDVLYTFPVTGAELDSMGGVWGLARIPGETDAQLTTRLKHAANIGRIDPHIQRLLYLLYRLGISGTKRYLPAGV